jgi:preprotein translocase subunit SecA
MEAEIISQAGKKGAVTIATNMAGRGTDIVLGGNPQNSEEAEFVKNAGGLHILGTERHDARRIDNQLRGRSGRQGDPGSSRFYLSLEDELMRLFGSERISGLMQKLGMQEGEEIQHPWISRAIENAQKKVEGMNFDIRKHLLDYDNVMNKQREAIYRLRNEILEGEDITLTVTDMLSESIDNKLAMWAPEKLYPEQWDMTSLHAWLSKTFGVKLEISPDELKFMKAEQLSEAVHATVREAYDKRESELTKEVLHQVQRMILLQMIDTAWKEHLYDLDQIKKGIGLRAYGQKDPLIEYKKESFAMFEQMMNRIREATIEYIFRFQLVHEPVRRAPIVQNIRAEKQESANVMTVPGVKAPKAEAAAMPAKLGRNDPCPCGSGKKYKKCCGK